jgi:hypothetical protein
MNGAPIEATVNGVDAGDRDAVEPGFGDTAGGVETEIVNFLEHSGA